MQKLRAKFKNVPTDASLVCSSTSTELNRDQSLSAPSKVLTRNNLEVNPVQHTGRQNLRVSGLVYVLNRRGKPLMPTSFKKAKLLVKQGKAKLVKSYPFTIWLCCATGEAKQEIVLGEDPGYKSIGFSCVTEKEELVSGVVELENGMSKRLVEKKMYRQGRRNKLWYRKVRFNNRANARKEGRLMPSVQRRLDAHINLVTRLMKLLPISQINIEVANFDIQKIENPGMAGKDYQQGSMYGYENVKAYIIAREDGKCQLCGKEFDKQGWHLHHVVPRSKGGTDKPNNLALLHKKCHAKLHKQKLFKKLKPAKQYKAETFMSIIRWKLVEEVKKLCGNVQVTYGYETKVKRIEQQIEKAHNNDAFVIAEGNQQKRSMVYSAKQKKHNSRVLQLNRKGHAPSIRRSRSSIQPGDIFCVGSTKYISKGMSDYGRYVWYGDSKKKEYFKIGIVENVFHTGSWQFVEFTNHGDTKGGIPPEK